MPLFDVGRSNKPATGRGRVGWLQARKARWGIPVCDPLNTCTTANEFLCRAGITWSGYMTKSCSQCTRARATATWFVWNKSNGREKHALKTHQDRVNIWSTENSVAFCAERRCEFSSTAMPCNTFSTPTLSSQQKFSIFCGEWDNS